VASRRRGVKFDQEGCIVKRWIVLGVAAATFGFGAQAALAANFKVFLGEQARPPAGTPKGATLDSFLPSAITVNVGDSITFSSATFHTVTYAPKPAPLFIPDPAKGSYMDIADSAGSPFYFNGLSKLIYNPVAFAPAGPKTISGTTPVSSGVLSPPGRKPVTATYAFPVAGVYHLFCQVHPGMKATVTVKPSGGALPKTPAQVAAQALSDVSAGWSKAKAEVAATKPAANTVIMGLGTTSALLAYFPKVLTVKAGTTVTFVNKSPSEVHNVVFGPKKYISALSKKTDLLPQGPNSPNQVAPFLPFGSEPKGQYTYDGTNHGNGFLVTPLTAGSALVPLPKSSSVTFTKPGRYSYFCWIHGPDMSGTIVVTS
jgi:plastocyanin